MFMVKAKSRAIFAAKSVAISAISALSPSDRLTLDIVRTIAMRNKPRASRHLNHYMYGNGKELRIDTRLLLKEDPNVCHEFCAATSAWLRHGLTQGRVPVHQQIYSNCDWLYALGGININWVLEGNMIVAWFINRYRWHPLEPRITQPIHRAAESLKRYGAKEFTIVGSKVRLSFSAISKTSVKRVGGRYSDFHLL